MSAMRFFAVAVTGLILGFVVPLGEAAPASTQVMQDDLNASCGPPPPGHPTKGRRDFRQRNADAQNQRDFRIFEVYHLGPAEARIRAGDDLQFDVMNNLHFALHKVPNHEKALRLLIEWHKAGGRQAGYAPPMCYFAWASQFAPDDFVVWNYGGYLFRHDGDAARATMWWQRALTLDPSNAELNYNLGLAAFSRADYKQARELAWVAYSGGYPLPGLRNKLQAVGQWHDAPKSSAQAGE